AAPPASRPARPRAAAPPPRGHAGRPTAAIVAERHLLAAREIHGAWTEGDPGNARHHDQRDDQKDADGPFAPAAHAFFLPARRSRSIGSRCRAMPVAARMALRSAGGPPFAPVSPMPPGGSPLFTTRPP